MRDMDLGCARDTGREGERERDRDRDRERVERASERAVGKLANTWDKGELTGRRFRVPTRFMMFSWLLSTALQSIQSLQRPELLCGGMKRRRESSERSLEQFRKLCPAAAKAEPAKPHELV